MSTIVQYSSLRDSAPIATVTKPQAQRVPHAAKATTDSVHEDAVFSKQQIREFHADDAAAMGTIARIMTALFTYTVVIMSVVILWTFAVVS